MAHPSRRGLSAGATEEDLQKALEQARLLKDTVVKIDSVMRARSDELKARHAEGKSVLYPKVALAVTYFTAAHTMIERAQWGSASAIFLLTLREFKHAPADRKILEEASRIVHQRRYTISRDRDPARDLERYERVYKTLLGATSIALISLSGGGVCEKNECAAAGCFRVVNTGGFDQKVMALAEREVKAAADIVTKAGFPEVCYGDAYIVARISQANHLAFWVEKEDRIYVRAKPSRGEEALTTETIVHELGHRFEHLFLSPAGQREVHRLYAEWKARLERSGIDMPADFDCSVGTTFKAKNGIFRVVKVEGSRVTYENVKNPQRFGTMSCKDIARVVGAAKYADNPFPTRYATTNAHELFAELFALVLTGSPLVREEHKREFARIVAMRKAPVGQTSGRRAAR